MRTSDWSSDVCSSDLRAEDRVRRQAQRALRAGAGRQHPVRRQPGRAGEVRLHRRPDEGERRAGQGRRPAVKDQPRSEEHTSELQSLMRISYAVFRLKKKNTTNNTYI